MNPYQREYQITIPSSPPARRKGAEMIDATKQRRSFQGRSFNKQAFYNCVILGLHDIETKRDLDIEEVEAKGLLAVVIDRGASELSRLIASADAPFMSKGVRASIGRDDEHEDDEEDEAPVEHEPPAQVDRSPKKPPMLIVPRNWIAPRRHDRLERADQKTKAVGDGPLP